MFHKLVAIEPVSLVPSAEKELYSFAEEVILFPDVPAGMRKWLPVSVMPMPFF